MKSIRRLYFYLVALISMEVVLWGLINLMRTMFASGLVFPGADTLAQALALILVGVPIFAIHWGWAQNASAKDPEENSASLRALFFYSILLITLLPVTQNLLALFNRTLMVSAGIDSYRAFLGGTQTWIDNLIAILLNLVAAGYFYNILRSTWAKLNEPENFADIRRLYRYIWVLYGLLMTVFGAQQVIRFLFYLPNSVLGPQGREIFVNGLALILVGTPVWIYSWALNQQAQDEAGERGSILRLAVLYLLALAGVLAVLSSAGILIDLILRRLLGEALLWPDFVSQAGAPISVGLPLAVVWGYYGAWLEKEIAAASDEPRRAALKRFYLYILAFIGLVATFIGLALLISFIISLLTENAIWGETLRPRLSGALATLFASLPLWLLAWRPLQTEALASSALGDHARRSVVRRAYLYLVIFASVIGGMASAIFLVYTLLFGVLDQRTDNFLTDILNGLQLIVLFSAFLAYHWNALRNDSSHAADALAVRQSLFSVLIFESESGTFATPILEAIQRASNAIPVAIQPIEQGIPKEAVSVRAVVLPSSLVLDPPEALRLWIKDYPGPKLIVPMEQKSWYWPYGNLKNSAGITAQIIRQLAEGQEVRVSSGAAPWQIALYVFAALFALPLLLSLIGLGISWIAR